MFRNYFKTAWRNLTRDRSYSIINILGLIVGSTAFILIYLVIQYNQSFDNFHPNGKNIYRVVRVGRNAEKREYSAGLPFPVSQALRKDFPQIKITAAVLGARNVPVEVKGSNSSASKKFKEPDVLIAEPQFFKIFNFSMAEGNGVTALSKMNTALLTKEIAAKYFGNWKTALGKTINLLGRNVTVSGILNNPPSNTDFPISIVLSYSTVINEDALNDWVSIQDNQCFVELNDQTAKTQLDALLKTFMDKHLSTSTNAHDLSLPSANTYDLSLQPLNEMHFDGRYGNFKGRTFSRSLILALGLIGLFLLIIACVNFINLTTAQAINRSREVSVRKVLGGSKIQLVGQFLAETGLITLLSLIGSMVLVVICLRPLNNLLKIHLTATTLFTTGFITFIIAVWLVVTFLSGFYPSLILSGFRPTQVLKNAVKTNATGISFRRALVVFQFVIAQILIIGTLVVVSQMAYFSNADMGFRKNAIINAHFPDDSLSRTKTDLLFSELNRIPGVQQVSFSTFSPADNDGWYTALRIGDAGSSNVPAMVVSMKPADTGYFSLYNLPLVAGRVYFPSDTMREFVVNETLIRNMGIRNPDDAIGKLIRVNGKLLPIVGVVKDYHIASLRDSIRPVVMTSMKHQYELANLKINIAQAKSVIAAMQNIWNKDFPDYAFDYSFLDQSIANYYKQEDQLSILYKLFAVIAIFISCLGLYGLITFLALQRRKEIGIRKVLGAPVRDILIMLSKEFTILITIAFLIAAPVASYFMHKWLQQYTYRISLGVWFYIVTISGSLLIAWITVSYTTIKAALANPVKNLRTE